MAQILLYPVIGDDFETESYQRYGVGYYNTTKAMRWYWEQYAPHHRDNALVVPSRAATLAGGLPPALVATAELDPPCSEGEAYAERLAADGGVPVIAHRFEGLFHGFLTFPPAVVDRAGTGRSVAVDQPDSRARNPRCGDRGERGHHDMTMTTRDEKPGQSGTQGTT